MVKINLSDVLNIYVGGVGDINITCPDEVKEVFFCLLFPTALLLLLAWEALGGEWGCREFCMLWLWEMVVAVLCGGR